MALPSNYRWIAVGKLAIRNRKNSPHYAPEFVIADLIDALRDRIADETVFRPYAKETKLMWCRDLTEGNEYFQLLLQLGDKNVSDMSYYNFQTDESRDIEKEEDEGGHFGAHILIKREPDDFGNHLILIEKVPGIQFSSVKDHLGWICRHEKYEKEARDENGKIKRFTPVIQIVGHQSRTIREALRTGVLQDIEFVSSEATHDNGLDEEPSIREVIHEAKWDIRRRLNEEQATGLLSRINPFRQQRGMPDDTQVFVRIKADNGQVRQTEIMYDGTEALEQAFIQNELVRDFETPLTQRYNRLRADMVEKIQAVGDAQAT